MPSRHDGLIVGSGVKTRGNPLASICVRLLLCVGCFVVVGFFVMNGMQSGPTHPSGLSYIGDDQKPLIVLYHGQPSEAPYEWNTGVWPSWGEYTGDMYGMGIPTQLRWQAEGSFVVKGCDVHCHITHDQARIPEADAVVMELVNHYKFYGADTTLPIPWPQKISPKKPLLGLFHYESRTEFGGKVLNDPVIMSHFDFTAIPGPEADLPVTLICPWGYEIGQYLAPPPKKTVRTSYTHPFPDEPVFVADFRGTIPPGYKQFFEELSKELNIDFFAGPYKNANAPEPYNLPDRLKHMGRYMFVIVAEDVIEQDWISPEFSQALVAGAVPLYIGAPNIQEYLPGAGAIVNGKEFNTATELAQYITSVGSDPSLYSERHMAWKANGLPLSFRRHLYDCAHLAECRICTHVLSNMQ